MVDTVTQMSAMTLFRVFFSSVHTIASHYYTREQIDAWAPADIDLERWANHIKELQPFVVELDGEIAGYADVQPNGYIDHVFFLRHGFHIVERGFPICRGVTLQNALMRKCLAK